MKKSFSNPKSFFPSTYHATQRPRYTNIFLSTISLTVTLRSSLTLSHYSFPRSLKYDFVYEILSSHRAAPPRVLVVAARRRHR
jgi:hypothetical protein